MRTLPEIEQEIRETKREMKRLGVRRVSCFNGGLTADENRWNCRLFNLNTEKKTVEAIQEASK